MRHTTNRIGVILSQFESRSGDYYFRLVNQLSKIRDTLVGQFRNHSKVNPADFAWTARKEVEAERNLDNYISYLEMSLEQERKFKRNNHAG